MIFYRDENGFGYTEVALNFLRKADLVVIDLIKEAQLTGASMMEVESLLTDCLGYHISASRLKIQAEAMRKTKEG